MTTFINFAKSATYDEMFRQFEAMQAETDRATADAKVQAEKAKLFREYQDVCEDFQKLFAGMMKKLLNARNSEEIQKIKNFYSIKLEPLAARGRLLEGKVKGNVPADIAFTPETSLASLAETARKGNEGGGVSKILTMMEDVKSMLRQVEKKQEPTVLAPPTGTEPAPG
jgi:hypothetical protein